MNRYVTSSLVLASAVGLAYFFKEEISRTLTERSNQNIWLVGVFSSLVFGFVGILPAFFIRSDKDEEEFKNSILFKLLLAFAAGSLLTDVFLHLIPEAFSEHGTSTTGLYCIGAFVLFFFIDKLTGFIPDANALGVLNLIANFFDNSAHGTTVVGAFESSLTFGLLALIATIIHEVPHEFADFALLLRSGYSRRNAIWAQLLTAFAGSLAATFAYVLGHQEGHNEWVLPFTIGGFLYIALVGIVPEMVEEKDKKISILQIITFICGILLIVALTEIEKGSKILFAAE